MHEKHGLHTHLLSGGVHRRAVLKTCSYALMHMFFAILVAYILSGSWGVAFAIGLVEPCVQTVAYFFHEKAWHRYESEKHQKDHHDSIIDSVSPATKTLEDLLHKRHKKSE